MTTLERVTKEIVDLHDFFTEWFNGTVERDQLEPRFLSRLHKNVAFIPPEGMVMTGAMLKGGLTKAMAQILTSAFKSVMWMSAMNAAMLSWPRTPNGRRGRHCQQMPTTPVSPPF